MSEMEWRCRQCAALARLARHDVPQHGARVRCPTCGTLQMLAPAGTEPSPAAPPSAFVSTPADSEARDLLRGWMHGIVSGVPGPLTGPVLLRDHAESLASLFEAWVATHPGAAARASFRTELLDLLDGLEGGGPASR